jgi:hypothetical protein
VALSNLFISAHLPLTLHVTDAGDGMFATTHIDWHLAALAPSQKATFSYAGTLSSSLKQGDVVTTIVEVTTAQGGMHVATTDVNITEYLPVTGTDDRFLAPLDNDVLLRPYVR